MARKISVAAAAAEVAGGKEAEFQWNFPRPWLKEGGVGGTSVEDDGFPRGRGTVHDDERLGARETLRPRSPGGLKDPPPQEVPLPPNPGDQVYYTPSGDNDDDEDDVSRAPGREFSGFETVLAKMGENIFEPAVVERELQWQNEGVGETESGWEEFKDQVLQLQSFRAFVIMQEQSPYLTICHSVGKFFNAPGEHAQLLHGKYIGVVGDRRGSRDPSPIIIPKEVWEWTTPVVHTNVGQVKAFYAISENYDQLYCPSVLTQDTAPPAAAAAASAKGKGKPKQSSGFIGDEREVHVPFMLSIPSYIMGKLSARAYWTPYDLWKIIEGGIKEYDGQIASTDWNVMRDWCLAACQQKGNITGDSILALRVAPVAQLDDSFHKWFDYRLDMIMGQRHVNTTGFPAVGESGGAPPTMTNATPPQVGLQQNGLNGDDLATQVGRGIALGLQAVTNAGLAAQGVGVGSIGSPAGETTKLYSPDAIAAIKGFSCTRDIRTVPGIWATFQTTKNVDVQRRHLHFGMEQWARTQGVEIDRGVFFEQKTIEDIVNLRFNPGQGVAQFKSAERGLSLLICRTRTPEEIERVRDREAAEQLTQATRVLEEALKLSRGDPRAPAGNYFELKLNITTFCALLHTLFGDTCDYYRTLMLIRNCMDSGAVYNIRQAYSADICHRISWAIIDDGRSYFSTVMIQQDFAAATVTFPVSLLDSILPEVRYANQIMRANYPKEWQPMQPSTRTTTNQGGASMGAWQQQNTAPPPNQDRRSPAGGGQSGGENWDDPRHHKIVTMMAPYIAKFGNNVFVGELMDAAGVRVNDLPIPVGTRFASKDNTKAYLCWNAVLGKCRFGASCKYKKNHPKKNELSDEFAASVVTALQQAVNFVVSTKEASPKKLKVEKVA